MGILESGHLSCDPLIWSKVTSLSSTASVLREDKISLKFQECIQKIIEAKEASDVIVSAEVIEATKVFRTTQILKSNNILARITLF